MKVSWTSSEDTEQQTRDAFTRIAEFIHFAPSASLSELFRTLAEPGVTRDQIHDAAVATANRIR